MVQKLAQITLKNQNVSYASTTSTPSRPIMMCELCGGEHNLGECLNDDMNSQSSMEHVDLVGYGRPQQSFQPQGAYNPNASRNHPGFSWSNPMGAANPQNFGNRGPPPGFQGQQNFRGGQTQQFRPTQGFQAPTTQPRQTLPTLEAPPPPNWEAMMEMMVKSQLQSDERFRQVTERLDQLSAHNMMLERQIANQASTSSTKVTGKLPACPENPREHVNAIVTRSGKKLEEPPLPVDKSRPSKIIDVDVEKKLEEEEASPPVLNPRHQGHEKDDREKPERKYVPPLPFPQKFQKQAKDSRWTKFLDVVENLKVSIPLLDLLTQTPSYGKFLREILSKKRKFGDQEMIAMTQEYRALKREDDPGKFTIPCVIGGSTINRSLCDLGASVNIMPLSLCKKLNLGEPQPVQFTLQFADRSTKSPIGILEDVPVRVDKYFVPCDFVVMDIREDPYIPIILGRPFLATTGAIIDAKKGSIIFDFGEEKVAFNVLEDPNSRIFESCYMVDVIDSKTLDEDGHLNPHDERTLDERELWKSFLSDGDANFAHMENSLMVEKVEEKYILTFCACVENFIEASDGGSLTDHPG